MIICDKKIVRIPLGDETLTIQNNRSDGYASIVASEQRDELFDRIGTLEQDNMRLRGMLGVERQKVDRLRRSISIEKPLTKLIQKNVKYEWEEKEEEAFQQLMYYNDAEGGGDSLCLSTIESS
ncbi:hypothetical protein Tco_0085436 [Tanacetum coccineum]